MPSVRSSRSTRERLLDAAEELLLASGYDEVSVRGICARAEANPAAVHYHFGSKEQLVAALLETRLAPVWADRLDRVREQSPTVPQLVETIWAPMAEQLADPLGGLRLSLLSRFVLTHPQIRWDAPWFGLSTWAQALQRAVPGLDETAARRRLIPAFALLLTQVAPGVPLSDEAARALRDFLIAGLGAPPN